MRYALLLVSLGLMSALSSRSFGQEISDRWHYTLEPPAVGWQEVGFDDSQWKEGNGGFGTKGTPGARIGTRWASKVIWLRKSFELKEVPSQPAILIHHDEDAQVYLNGRKVADLSGFTSAYQVVRINEKDADVIRAGQMLMAVHCKQTTGGQFIDAHLIDARHVPELPEPPRDTKPFQSDLITKWGEEVTPQNAWTQYPRPQLVRENWTNLNGHWDYAVAPASKRGITEWMGKILVPFCLESKLGGVERLLNKDDVLFYRRTFDAKRSDKRLLIHFEAVDYRCEVLVNGKQVGKHVGGNTPFTFDITDQIKDGENELFVRVEDATEEFQLRGKQVLNPGGIWYTQVSGIWQTVWLEEVPTLHAERLKIDTKIDGKITVTVVPSASQKNQTASSAPVQLIAKLDGKEVARAQGSGTTLSFQLEDPRLWSPASPVLYDLEVRFGDDVVQSYFGVREVGKVKGDDGHWRFTLNGEPIFHWGPLDQGWWPDGLLTPPSDEAMAFDVQWLKRAGFNMIRKHIKVEPRRYYYHCDRLGMMVWQDQVSGGVGEAWPKWTRLDPNPVDAVWPPEHHEQFMLELDRMITSLESHPSIVCWVPFNEAWGQHRTMEVGKWTVERDPSRLVNVASGGNFWPVGDIVDEHRYPHPGFPFELNVNGRFDDFIKVVGEFGGHGLPITGHLWDANRDNWGYGGLPKNKEEYKERYVTSLKMLSDLRKAGIAAGVYTQTTDVEGEINGLMTYDRKAIKIPADELAKLHNAILTNSPPQAAK